MTTPWTAAVAFQDIPWPEYPRPQMQRPAWLNLNGWWDFAVTPLASAPPQEFGQKIKIPFPPESLLSGVGENPGPLDRLWYARKFTRPPGWTGRRLLLHFGAVDWECQLFVNGAPAGVHRGGFDPFFFDITAFLQVGENALVLGVTDPCNYGDQARGKQDLAPSAIFYTNTSGIWQSVWLEPVPEGQRLERVRLEALPDLSTVEITAQGATPTYRNSFAVALTIKDGEKTVASGTGWLNEPFQINIPEARTWSPDDPHRYTYKATLHAVSGGTDPAPPPADLSASPATDFVSGKFALRHVAIREGRDGRVFTLNQKPVFHFGPLDQGYWPDGLMCPPSRDALRHELEYLRDAGFNMLRKHIKVEPAVYYDLCEEIGLMVWQDLPCGFQSLLPGPLEDSRAPALFGAELAAAVKSKPRAPQFLGAREPSDAWRGVESQIQFETEVRRIVEALRPFGCIVSWVVFNEGWGQYETGRVSGAVAAWDASRPLNAVSGWVDLGHGEVHDLHNYHEDLPISREKTGDRVFVLGEFGGVACRIDGHLWGKTAEWGYQSSDSREALANALEVRFSRVSEHVRTQALAAAIYTQTTDVEGEINGLLTYDRRVAKLPAAELKKRTAPVLDAFRKTQAEGREDSPKKALDIR